MAHRSIIARRIARRSFLGVSALGLFAAGPLGCSKPPIRRDPPIPERVTGSFIPPDAMRQALLKRQALFWEAVDAGRLSQAYGMLTLDLREDLRFAPFRNAYPPIAAPRQIARMHWLKDAPHMPGPEVFCVVLWTAPGVGGELVWRLEPDGVFYIQSSDQRAG